MSKTTIGIIIAIVIIVGGYYIYNANKIGTDVLDNTSVTPITNTDTSATPTTNKVAFTEFVKKGGTLTCAITQNISGTKVTGTLFMGSGMMRGEYITKEKGTNVNSSFIVRDGFTYTWSSLTPATGFKVAIPVIGSTAATVNTSSFDVSQVSDYDCQNWTLDQTKFTLPAGVTFTLIAAN